MGRRKTHFLGADFSSQFDDAYAKLQHGPQKAVDKVVIALLKEEPTPGMRVKPIEPESIIGRRESTEAIV